MTRPSTPMMYVLGSFAESYPQSRSVAELSIGKSDQFWIGTGKVTPRFRVKSFVFSNVWFWLSTLKRCSPFSPYSSHRFWR